MVPDIALAASAREWPDRLHRFLLDHGGGRVIDRVLSPDRAGDGIDVLIIDDVCSFLSPNLVSGLKQRGSEVIGVFDPDDGADAKRRLLECGISDVIESDATPEEFLRKIEQTLAHRFHVAEFDSFGSGPVRIGVTGASEGVGITEVAVALASELGRDISTGLVDLDPLWPSVAQRLGLPLHPNIRTLVDHVLHEPSRIESSLHRLDGLVVVGGRADGPTSAPLSRHESQMVLDSLDQFCDVAVIDVGPAREADPVTLRELDTLIIVGHATPVGVSRLIMVASQLAVDHPVGSVLLVVNMVPRKRFHRSEVIAEIDRALPGSLVFTLPRDDRVSEAAWDGRIRTAGPFRRAVRSMSDVVVRSMT